MSLKTRHVFEFENFRLDTSEKVLSRDGMAISLTPKVFDTLQVLIENAGHLVEKDELMQRVWQERFVEESNLTFNIKMLRKALGDDAGKPRFIETVPRRGYRFIVKTAEIFAENGNSSSGSAEARFSAMPVDDRIGAGRGISLRKLAWLFVLIVLFIGGVAVASWYLMAATSRTRDFAQIFSATTKSEALSYSGSVFCPRISLDGKYVAYVAKEVGDQTVWLRELATGMNFPLLAYSKDEYLGLMFSSKSDFVYFVRKPSGGSQDQAGIYRISIFGGIPTRVVTNNQGWFSLSPVDDRIAFVRYDADHRSLLTITDADGKDERILATRERRPYNFRATRWSSDGATIAVAVGQSENGANDVGLVEINVSSGKEREITPRKFLSIADIEWLPEKAGLLFTARENNSPNNQIWQVSFDSGEAVKLVDDGSSYTTLSLSSDATRLVISETIPDFRLTVINAADMKDPFSVASSPAVSNFTASGKVLYTAAKGQTEIWIMNADGSGQKQLTNDPMEDYYPLPSPDEKYVFFTSTRSGDRQIWRMKMDGSDPVRITQKEGGFPLFISPDGKTLYYLSALNRNLWKVSVEGGQEIVFYDAPVLFPAFSSDGKHLAYFYRNADQNNSFQIAVLSTDRLDDRNIFRQQSEADGPVQIAWAPDSLSFYYAASGQVGSAIWRQSLTARAPEKIRDIGDGDVLDFSVSQSGNKFAYVSGAFRREARLIKSVEP